MMAKLTEKQQKLLDKMFEFGGWMSRKHIATYHSVSVADALVKKGMLELTDTRNYKLTYEGGAALTVSKPAAIAQPVSVATDAAPAWTPAVNDTVRIASVGKNNGVVGYVREIDTGTRGVMCRVYGHWYYQGELELVKPVPEKPAPDNIVSALIRSYFEPEIDDDDARYLGAPLPTGGVSAPDAAQTAAAEADETPVSAKALIDADIVALDRLRKLRIANQTITKRDEQIAALTRDLEAAKAEADALHDALEEIDQLASYPDESDCEPGDVWCLVKKIRQIAFNATQTDAASMIAALRQRDNDPATWLTTADVIAQSGFAEED